MKTDDKVHRLATPDHSLRYMMRGIGLLLAAVSMFFLTQDLGQVATSTTVFFVVGACIGLITMGMSWLPAEESVQLQEAPVRSGRSRR